MLQYLGTQHASNQVLCMLSPKQAHADNAHTSQQHARLTIKTWWRFVYTQWCVAMVQVWVQSLFLFALVWSVGANTDEEGRTTFDHTLRKLLINDPPADLKPYIKVSTTRLILTPCKARTHGMGGRVSKACTCTIMMT